MLDKLRQLAGEGNLRITHVYLGHIKVDDDRKQLLHAQASEWETLEPAVSNVLQRHLFQMIDGEMGEVNFACMYTGELLSVHRVASAEYDRTRNRPAVEVLEAIRDMPTFDETQMVEIANLLAYKVMAAGAISNHLVAVLRLEATPEKGASPFAFSFATVVDMEDREESLFDEGRSLFVIQLLTNAMKGSKAKLGVIFPCLDDDGREMADMLVMTTNGSPGWFDALEATRRYSPKREGQVLIKLIAEQAIGGLISSELFNQMGAGIGKKLLADATREDGMTCDELIEGLEKGLGHGIDRMGFQARWEGAFGDLGYRPTYGSIFGPLHDWRAWVSPTQLKMQAGDVKVTVPPHLLHQFRQIQVGDKTFIAFEVSERAKILVGTDLNMMVRPVVPVELVTWLNIGIL